MTGKKLRLWIFVAAALLQVSGPASMIGVREWVLHTGDTFRFRTAPVDPYDAFRGRYVALDFDLNRVDVGADHEFRRGDRVYLLLDTDEGGFASVGGLARDKPREGAYLETPVRSTGADQIRLALPFDRYYMEETRAPRAEALYRRSNTPEKKDAFAQVRVRAGRGVLEELYVGGVPVHEALEAGK